MTNRNLRALACGAARLTVAAAFLAAATPALAQARTSPIGIRGFADAGSTRFAATRSFEAVLGTASGPVFGGGGEVLLPRGIFVSLRGARFRDTGQRVFVSGGQTYPLGIPTLVTVRPLELTAGYRLNRPGWRVIPYAGGGTGWHKYTESSDFADPSENVSLTATGYHVLGGAEFPILGWLAGAVEAQWSRVPDGLGADANGVSAAFGESDMGGTTLRVKVVLGR